MKKFNNKTKEDNIYIAKKKNAVMQLARKQVVQEMKLKIDELFVEELNNIESNK